MTTPDERAFFTYPRGQIRDEMLAFIRTGFRRLVNPETGEVFTEDEIRIATQEGSREFIRCDAIDLLGQAGQLRARFTAQQANPKRASSSWLRSYWVPLWLPDGPLPASSGSGPATWSAPNGAVFIGSTTPGDPAAFQATDPAGNIFQALTTVVSVGGVASLTLFSVVGGAGTNPKSGTVFSINANQPLDAAPTGSATGDFSGGFDAENDADLSARVVDVIARRPASGNNAQFRAWARASSNAVENAWVYACALNAGTVIVAITQKRGTTVGPLARVPSDETLATARAFLTPPGSAVVPGRPFVLVQGVLGEFVSVGLTLTMRKSTPGGWADSSPWPSPVGTPGLELSRISSLASQTNFNVSSGISLPGGVSSLAKPNAPSVMAWDPATSIFEKLDVLNITDLGGGLFHVILDTPTAHMTLANNIAVSPFSQLAIAANGTDQGPIAQAMQAYFDSLGPGELFDISTDPRGSRAYRWPRPDEEAPSDAGQALISQLIDALSGAFSNASVTFLSASTPSFPTDLETQGPGLLALKTLGVYST